MVLGLIDFLLGSKRKSKLAVKVKEGEGDVSTNINSQQNSNDGNLESQNVQKQETQNNSQDIQNKNLNPVNSTDSNRKSLSSIILGINDQLKSTNDRITEMVSGMKSIENSVNTLGHKVEDLEESRKISEEKLINMDANMNKFLSLYELINNEYNPFIDKEIKVETPKKEIMIDKDGNSISSSNSFNGLENFKKVDLETKGEENLKNLLLELDTLDIEQAAGDAVPLRTLKNNTNSLVIILSWLEYLIKKIGIEETRNTLRYYTEVLRWITPEVFFNLDKYLRGMRDSKNSDNKILNIKDHIVSLYFISKLNEKTLDEKLTKAVLQIIKE